MTGGIKRQVCRCFQAVASNIRRKGVYVVSYRFASDGYCFLPDRKLKRYGTSFPILSLPSGGEGGREVMGFGEVGDSCGRWRGQKRGGRRYVEVAKPRNLVTNHPTRKRPAIHFLISIPQPSLIYTFILITIDSSPTISPLPLSYLHPIYIRVESEISRIIVFYRG